jgi:hypothetical protein
MVLSRRNFLKHIVVSAMGLGLEKLVSTLEGEEFKEEYGVVVGKRDFEVDGKVYYEVDVLRKGGVYSVYSKEFFDKFQISESVRVVYGEKTNGIYELKKEK